MISKVHIQNYKSLENVKLDLTNLNVLAGVNGGGKSSLIQVLLLLRQAYLFNPYFAVSLSGLSIPLKGALTEDLGSVKDVKYWHAKDDAMLFELQTNANNAYTWQMEDLERNISNNTLICQAAPSREAALGMLAAGNTGLFDSRRCQYISADRITPNDFLGKSPLPIEYKFFGRNGEYAIQYLNEYGSKHEAIIQMIFDENSKALPLEKQVNYWLNEVSTDVAVEIKPKSDKEYELKYKFYDGKGFQSFSAINSAYGLTAALPVITALLAAEKGDLVIIENPESDLHPKGQSKMGELIARVAQAGVQVIIETHSDHVLNGISVAVHDDLLENDFLKVFYFYKNKNQQHSEVVEIPVEPTGRRNTRHLRIAGIEGFFDQADTDLEVILSPKKQKSTQTAITI